MVEQETPVAWAQDSVRSWKPRELQHVRLKRELNDLALESSAVIKGNCDIFEIYSNERLRFSEEKMCSSCASSALPSSRVMSVSQTDKTMQQSSSVTQACRDDDLASLHSSRIKFVTRPKLEISWPPESEWALIYPSCWSKISRPGFVLDHLGHLIQIWVTGRARPPPSQKPCFWAEPGPDLVGEGTVTGGPLTDTEPGFCSPMDNARINLAQIFNKWLQEHETSCY